MEGMRRRAAAFLCAALCMAGCFAATMDPRVNAVPKQLMEQVFVEPEEALPAVVASLTSGVSGTAAKVKVLHDWICNNIAYDTVVFTDNYMDARDQSPAAVLKKRKAVCSGYTNLMCSMCRLAGIEAVGISGWSKGFGYEGNVDGRMTHAWNAVNMGGRWQLIDVTWDAGHCDADYFVKEYSTEWLYRTPREFLYSHLPGEDEYQYYAPLVSKEQFVAEPYIPGKFFEKGFGLVKDKSPLYANSIDGTARYELALPSKGNYSVYPRLLEKSHREPVDNATWLSRSSDRLYIDVDVPDARVYRLKLSAWERSSARYQNYFSVEEFEGDFLPRAAALLDGKKISQQDLDLFRESYEKVGRLGRYYYLEDLFALSRIRAVERILKLLDCSPDRYEEILAFDVQAADGYAGYGEGVYRFPSQYRDFESARSTRIVQPQGGSVRAGSTETFCVETKDFVSCAIYIDGKVTMMNKTGTPGIFELEVAVPDDAQLVEVMGSRDGRTLYGQWYYKVE